MGSWIYALLGILGTGAIVGVVYLWRRAIETSVARDEATAALELERQHVEAEERAAEADRVRRQKEFDAKAAAVHDADSAADLLRGELGSAPTDN